MFGIPERPPIAEGCGCGGWFAGICRLSPEKSVVGVSDDGLMRLEMLCAGESTPGIVICTELKALGAGERVCENVSIGEESGECSSSFFILCIARRFTG